MDGRIMAFLFGILGFAFGVVAYLSQRSKGDGMKKRLDLIEQGLQHPTLDESTRAELLRLLAEEQRCQRPFFERLAARSAIWRTFWFGAAWLMFIVGTGLVIGEEVGLIRNVDSGTVLTVAIAGFAMLTLPIGLRELQARTG